MTLEERDRWQAAVHECGHALACEHFGIHWGAYIVHNPNGSMDEKHWTGRTHFTLSTPFRNAVIAFAGHVAALVVEGETDMDLTDILDDDLSPTDLSHTHIPQRNRAWKLAWKILQARKPDLIRAAELLSKNCVLNRPEIAPLPQAR